MIPDQYDLPRSPNQRDQCGRLGGLRGLVDEDAGEPTTIQ